MVVKLACTNRRVKNLTFRKFQHNFSSLQIEHLQCEICQNIAKKVILRPKEPHTMNFMMIKVGLHVFPRCSVIDNFDKFPTIWH